MNEEIEVLEIEGFQDKEVEVLTLDEKKKPLFTTWQKIFIVFSLIVIVLGLFFAFVLYGKASSFREYLITNNTSLATLLYNDYTINNVLENNYLKEPLLNTDVTKITFEKSKVSNKYEDIIINHNSDKDYQIIKINENKLKGKMVIIYNPSILNLEKVNENNIDNYNAVLSIGNSGLITNDGKVLNDNSRANVGGGIIGIDEENRLVLGKYGKEDAKKFKFSTDYGPFLIVNGEKAQIYGNGGYPADAKNVIAQRQDGTILLFHINGFDFLTGSKGAYMSDLLNLLIKFNAYNAALLPGGKNSFLYTGGLKNSYNGYAFVIKK